MSFYFGASAMAPGILTVRAPVLSTPAPSIVLRQSNTVSLTPTTAGNTAAGMQPISIALAKPAPLTPPAASAATAAAQAQADADAAQAAQLAALQAQEAQAERDAAAAASYTSALVEDPSADGTGFGPWLWVGGAAAALGLIVIGFKVTRKSSPPVAGYRRRKRRSKR